jgi:ribulose-bisphosphate carboxylase large chain
MNNDRLIASYQIETPYSIERAAEVMAGEQSTGTFTAVPGETQQLKELYGARVISAKETGTVKHPSLPGAKVPANHDGLYRQGEVVLSFPVHNFGHSIPNVLTAVAGNLFELQEFSGLRLTDLEFPESFAKRYPGPKFGIEGTRRLAGVYDRPLIGTIVKPSIGLSTEELGILVRDLSASGIDFIKDDELNADPVFAPLEQRVKTVMKEIERAADRTGKKIMFAFNITGDLEELKRNHDMVVKAGGTCVMVSINSVGFAGLAYLNSFSELPIHGHRNQWGMYTRCPALGMSFTAYQKICRLAGSDHLHVNGLNSKFYEPNESVITSLRSVLSPMMNGYPAMPVLSSGQWAGTAINTYQSTQTVDVIHLAGGGILAHPDGPAAGAASMRQGWEAAVQGIDLYEYAEKHPELKGAIDKFSKIRSSSKEGE